MNDNIACRPTPLYNPSHLHASMSMRIIARHTSGRTVLPARRIATSRTFPRFQSTSSTNEQTSRVSSHLAAGLAGGGVVLVGGTSGYRYLVCQ